MECTMALVGVLPGVSGRFLSHIHPFLGLLSFSLNLHEFLHDLEIVIVLFQPAEAKLDVPILR